MSVLAPSTSPLLPPSVYPCAMPSSLVPPPSALAWLDTTDAAATVAAVAGARAGSAEGDGEGEGHGKGEG